MEGAQFGGAVARAQGYKLLNSIELQDFFKKSTLGNGSKPFALFFRDYIKTLQMLYRAFIEAACKFT
jgi:hypothetical protein